MPQVHSIPAPPSRRLSGWGRYPVAECRVRRPERVRDLAPDSGPGGGPCIPRGRGRAYGDAALSGNGTVILTERLDRFLALDEAKGLLTVEAGATVAEVLEVVTPRGWFLPVSPGTGEASIGGCVAADVHGKNHHHDGGFGAHVRALTLVTADGTAVRCSPEKEPELFWATVGGMGLTGAIAEVTLGLVPVESAYIATRHHRAAGLDAVLDLLDGEPGDAPYSVAWIDCLARGAGRGRGVVMEGRHASPDQAPGGPANALRVPPRRGLALPLDLPFGVVNAALGRLFNGLYLGRQGGRAGGRHFVVDYARFFHPLDALAGWNRLYGPRGFVQHQCVVPLDTGRKALHELLGTVGEAGVPAYLGVLKRLGAEGNGMLSFPMPGYTLALDLPMGPATSILTDRLDAVVAGHGGRIYLAKDATLKAERFKSMYPRLAAWQAVQRRVDPEARLRSDLSRRLGLVDAP
jgi:decaprenylphospho-beta-D-ribofuranose 2-oxidase